MTKYILVGGYPDKAPDKDKAFAEELINGFEGPAKILDCIFARPRETWEEVFADDKEFFKEHLLNKKFEIQLADPEDFTEQAKWASAIYFRGGRTTPLMELLNKNKGWEKELDGKTLAGTSAGANMMAKY